MHTRSHEVCEQSGLTCLVLNCPTQQRCQLCVGFKHAPHPTASSAMLQQETARGGSGCEKDRDACASIAFAGGWWHAVTNPVKRNTHVCLLVCRPSFLPGSSGRSFPEFSPRPAPTAPLPPVARRSLAFILCCALFSQRVETPLAPSQPARQTRQTRQTRHNG